MSNYYYDYDYSLNCLITYYNYYYRLRLPHPCAWEYGWTDRSQGQEMPGGMGGWTGSAWGYGWTDRECLGVWVDGKEMPVGMNYQSVGTKY